MSSGPRSVGDAQNSGERVELIRSWSGPARADVDDTLLGAADGGSDLTVRVAFSGLGGGESTARWLRHDW